MCEDSGQSSRLGPRTARLRRSGGLRTRRRAAIVAAGDGERVRGRLVLAVFRGGGRAAAHGPRRERDDKDEYRNGEHEPAATRRRARGWRRKIWCHVDTVVSHPRAPLSNCRGATAVSGRRRRGQQRMPGDRHDPTRKFRPANGFAEHVLDRVAAGPHTQIMWCALPAEFW